MSNDRRDLHNKTIKDQFTKQAVPFAERIVHSNKESTGLLIKMSRLSKHDTVLDVACGPGLLACALAPCAQKVTGIDLVPAMIKNARKTQRKEKISNIDWKIGDILPLPFVDSAFSVVVCRYAFHHFIEPVAVLKEMIRVAKPGGKVAVIDVFTSSMAQSGRYDKIEKLKDPSHVRTLPLAYLQKMVSAAGLINAKVEFYRIRMKLEDNLKASFPDKKSDFKKIRQAIAADVGKDKIGMGASREGKVIYLNYPIAIIVGEKA